MLPRLEAAALRGEIDAAEYGYLVDRIRMAQGRPQVYGTQYDVVTNSRGAAVLDANGCS